MTEMDKINRILEECKGIFEVTNMDVAKSLKGMCYFTRYDESNDEYDCFIRFETAEELAELMLGELAVDIMSFVDAEPDEQPEIGKFIDRVEIEASYKPNIERLMEYLGK